MKKSFQIFVFLTLGLLSASTYANTQSLEWAGCGISQKAYMIEMTKAFKSKYGIDVNMNGGGATKGIRKVADGSADIGGSCRYSLKDHSLEQGVAFEPVAWDALAVIVNPENPITNITFSQIQDLYLGKITNWKQLGGNDAPVKLYVRGSKVSGVGYTIRKLIFADIDKEFVASKTFKSSGPLEKAITEDPNAIGITGISSARLRNLKILKLNDKYPDYNTIRKGQYALYRPLFITFNPESPNIETIKRFIKFSHSSSGRKIMKQNDVVPYLEALVLVMKQVKQDRMAQYGSDNDLAN